nr:ribonuclease H-like domain-containing protein [Tanacetum cinerariifolium]
DLEQIHEDDLEAMDLRWRLSLLCMRAKRECRAQRNQDGQFRNKDNTKKQGNNKDTSSKAMLAIDGVGFDWSDMAEEHVQINMALMMFSESKANTAKPRVVNTGRPYIAPVNVVKEKVSMMLRPSHVGFGDLPDLMVHQLFLKDITILMHEGKPQKDDKGFIDNGCSRKMTENIAYLSNFKEFDGGYVTFWGGVHGGRIYGKATKDETSKILKSFIKEIENLVDKKVKIIRCANGTEFKNKVMDDVCREKGIKMEYSVARTPQENGVFERRNKTLIEAVRILLADSKLPTTFLAEAVSTACYVQEWIEGHVTSNKSVQRVNLLGNSKEVGTVRYLSLVVPLKKVGDEVVHKELGSGPRCQDTILGDVEAQTRFEAASKQFNDPPFSRVNTLGYISTANVPVTTVGVKISTASPEDKTAETSNDSDEITLVKTLIEIRRSATKPQKGVLVEEEPVKVERRDQGLAQIESDAELAQRLYEEELAEVDRAQKERQKQEEATIAILTEEFNEIQARMDVDHELAARLTYE